LADCRGTKSTEKIAFELGINYVIVAGRALRLLELISE